MYLNLFDRGDRLGANIINYIAQILYAYNKNYFLLFNKKKEVYQYYNSFFVKTLFNYIEKYNNELEKNGIIKGDTQAFFINNQDFITTMSSVLKTIKLDYISFFNKYIYNDIKNDFSNLISAYDIPFDVNKTILVHLRLDDVSSRPDYNGSICSDYYKNKIKNNEECHCEFYETMNHQAPLSKTKMDDIINKAKNEFPTYKVILITSPTSDTSYLNYSYEVIKSDDANYDLFLLTMCNVVILSRSTFSLSCMFFNNKKIKTYIPLWGHIVCTGLDTIYDQNDKLKIEYFV